MSFLSSTRACCVIGYSVMELERNENLFSQAVFPEPLSVVANSDWL
jgi:hypothetical protein